MLETICQKQNSLTMIFYDNKYIIALQKPNLSWMIQEHKYSISQDLRIDNPKRNNKVMSHWKTNCRYFYKRKVELFYKLKKMFERVEIWFKRGTIKVKSSATWQVVQTIALRRRKLVASAIFNTN